MRRFSLDKMRRNLARDTPDAVWRSFNIDSPTIEQDLNQWRENWLRMMKLKHKGKNMQIEIFRSEMIDDPYMMRFQLTAVEHKPIPIEKLIDSSMMTANDIRRFLGQKEL